LTTTVAGIPKGDFARKINSERFGVLQYFLR
jgi:hypothetical protein